MAVRGALQVEWRSVSDAIRREGTAGATRFRGGADSI